MNSRKIFTKNITALVLALFLLFPFSSFAQDGEAIFKNTCGACHTIGKGRLVGPDLSGVTTKRKEAWLLTWVKSSTAFIASGDADAKAIFAEFNNIPMPDQKLSEPEMKAVFTYISSKSPGAVAKTEAPKAPAPEVNVQPTQSEDHAVLFENPLMYLYIILFLFTAAVVYSVLNAKRILQRNGKEMNFSLLSARWLASNGKTVGVIFLIVVLAAIYFVVHYGK